MNNPINIKLETKEKINDFGILEIVNPYQVRREVVKNSTSNAKLEIFYIGDNIVINLIKNDLVQSSVGYNRETSERIKQAWKWGAEDELIACADCTPETLYVMGCDLRVWDISFESILCFEGIPISERKKFFLDEDGSYLYWEYGDIHLDLDSLRSIVDSEYQAKLLFEKKQYDKSFGKAIKALRKLYKLKQKDISGISDRHLRRLEKGETQVTLDLLKKLASAHGLEFKDYLEKINEKLESDEKI